MDDLDKVAERVCAAMHDLRVEPSLSAGDTARAARAIGARLRTRRRTAVLGATACVVAVVAIGGTALLRPPSAPLPDTAAVLPADQPQCPATLPTGNRPGGLLDGTSLTPTLATVCDYSPTTSHLRREDGQIRPVDLPGFLAFVRVLKAGLSDECHDTTVIEATSIQFLLPDKTIRALTAVSTARCVTLSDGSSRKTVPVTGISLDWAHVIDPALPFPPEPMVPNSGPVYTTPSGPPATARTARSSPLQTRSTVEIPTSQAAASGPPTK